MGVGKELAQYVSRRRWALEGEVLSARSAVEARNAQGDTPPSRATFEQVYGQVAAVREEERRGLPSPARVQRALNGYKRVKFDWHVGKRKPEAAPPAKK